MRITESFSKKLSSPEYKHIEERWLKLAYMCPEFRIKQKDGRISLYAQIPEKGNKYLRLILMKDGKTVREAHFDNSFNPRVAMRRARPMEAVL